MSEANDWQRRVYGGPSMADPLTCDDRLEEAECPNCRHPLRHHSDYLGCHVGWAAFNVGRTTEEGCACPLTLAGQHSPPKEADVPDV